MKKKKVAILGATGIIGQRLVQMLSDHPWFYINSLIASPEKDKKLYFESVNWKLETKIPEDIMK